jgi:hypothetical protein
MLFAACLVFLPGLPLSGRWAEADLRPVGEFLDWSTRYVVHPQVGPMAAMLAIRQDPRALFSWRTRLTRTSPDMDLHFKGKKLHFVIHRDWSINLGTAGTAIGMYPAKYTFDITKPPSCANDYATYPVNATGSSSQPNIVAFNNLYSGTSGGNGVCNRTPSGSDNGVSATVLWSYNVQGIAGGGAVPASPVVSYDPSGGPINGAKVAFVESAAGSPAHFHVLAWKATDGQNAANLQSVLTPKTINSFVAGAPAVGSGTASDLNLGSSALATDTLSSPFVDYSRDVAYVGNDIGMLYRIKDVFCTSINPDCSGANPPAPSIDASWGSGGSVSVCSGQLTAPNLDFVTLHVFVGCSDGKLYMITQAGVVTSIAVGDGVASKTYGAIVDPPIVDGADGFVYAVSGSANNGANGVLVQTTTTLSSTVAVPVGGGNECNLHEPALNNAYYTSPTSPGALIYFAGTTGLTGPCTPTGATGGNLMYYATTFGAGGVMTSGAPVHSANVGNPANEFAPFTEFYNPNIGTGTDLLFLVALCTGADMVSFNITAGWPGTTFVENPVTYGYGTSGMIVDNDANTITYPQSSSVYFNALAENAACSNPQSGSNKNGCAIKLTQAALQ